MEQGMNGMDTAPRDGSLIRIRYQTTSGAVAEGDYRWRADTGDWLSESGDGALADGAELIGWMEVPHAS